MANGKPIFTTSWDDGHPLDFRIAHMLSRYGLRGTFYIPREIGTGVMSESQMRELSESFEVGAHTIHHVFLDTADDETARREIHDSKDWVEHVTGKPCPMFCPPGGKHTSRHLEHVRDAGYSGVRTVELMSLDHPRELDDLQIMPTTLQAHPHGAGAYFRNAIKRRNLFNAWNYLARGSSDWTKAAEAMMRRAIEIDGVFHLWGHSWEIERFGQWDNLDRVLRMMGELSPGALCLTNGELANHTRIPAAIS